MTSLSFRTALILILGTIVFSVGLAELYSHTIISPAWLTAGLWNLIFAVVVVIYWRKRDAKVFSLTAAGDSFWQRWVWYLPGTCVILACLTLATISRTFSEGAQSVELAQSQFIWVLIIPVIEELAFRLGLSELFRRWGGVFWGGYFSAMIFALVHGTPTIANVMNLQFGLPLGPFLLALCCEALYAQSRRLAPLVWLHVGCNSTVVIFGSIDARWLSWLGLFYH